MFVIISYIVQEARICDSRSNKNITHYVSNCLFRGSVTLSKREKNFKEIIKHWFIVKVHIKISCNNLYFVMMLNSIG
jgi:hypothetical protein